MIYLLNAISSVIAFEGTKHANIDTLHHVCDGDGEQAKSVSLSSRTSLGSEISTAIDRASMHLNNFIGIKTNGDNGSALLRKKYSNLCIITCRFGEFSLLLREEERIFSMERFGCDGHAALSRARDLGYCTRCREKETLVCHIGRKDEEMIVCVLSCAYM